MLRPAGRMPEAAGVVDSGCRSKAVACPEAAAGCTAAGRIAADSAFIVHGREKVLRSQRLVHPLPVWVSVPQGGWLVQRVADVPKPMVYWVTPCQVMGLFLGFQYSRKVVDPITSLPGFLMMGFTSLGKVLAKSVDQLRMAQSASVPIVPPQPSR